MTTTRVASRRAPLTPRASHYVAPVILTARQLLTTHPALADRLRVAGRQLLLVNGWDRLLVGVEKTVVDIVLVDMDAADRAGVGRQRISGHRLVALLARRLAEQARARAMPGARLAVLTQLDYAEIEDLVRLGVHTLARPDHDPDALLDCLCGPQARAWSHSHTEQAPTQTTLEPAPAGAPGEPTRLTERQWRQIAAIIATTAPATTATTTIMTANTRRQRVSDRAVLEGLCHLLRTGGGWASYPASAGSPSTARRRLQHWREAGVLARLAELARAGDRTMQELMALPWARLGGADGARARKVAHEVAQRWKQ